MTKEEAKALGATHCKNKGGKLKYYQLKDGFFYKLRKKKRVFTKLPVRLAWDSSVTDIF